MITNPSAAILLFCGSLESQGSSETAHFIASQAQKGRQQLQGSYTYGYRLKRIREELYALSKECAKPNWDAYGAEPVRSETYHLGYRFLDSLPVGVPLPEVGAEPDGHIRFEWYRSTHRTLSLSISPEGDLHYSALLGPNKAYGTEVFFGAIPQRVFDLIEGVYAS
jgi:hypothetical protein